MKTLWIVAFALFASSAYGYKTGTYTCKNANPNLPANTYEIKDVELGDDVLPYVIITRYTPSADPQQPHVNTVRGLATVAMTAGQEYLGINQIRLQFDGEKLVNCRDE